MLGASAQAIEPATNVASEQQHHLRP